MKQKKRLQWLALFLCLALLLCGCGPQTPGSSSASAPDASVSTENSPEASTAETGDTSAPPEEPLITSEDVDDLAAGVVVTEEELYQMDVDSLFYEELIPDQVFARMEGVSYREGCPVSREDLRYVRVLHMGFDGKTHVGELVCHQDLAQDMVEIFKTLYQEGYPIEKMHLVDDYGGDDEASMEDNNTSCFNFRPVSGTSTLSQHAYGRAIDINPLYNPYVTASGYEPANAGAYVDRTAENPYAINPSDLCYQLFADRGYTWGGYWQSVQDYQHFEK